MNLYNTRINLSGRVLFPHLGLTTVIYAMVEADSMKEVKGKAQKYCKEKYGFDVTFADPILVDRRKIEPGELLIN